MSSMRLVGIGLVMTLALLPAMLLSIVRGHDETADANIAMVAAAGEDSKTRAWQGEAKRLEEKTPAAAGAAVSPAADAAAVVELYLPEAEAAQMGASLGLDAPGLVVLSFGPAMVKSAAGRGVDPFVGSEAGKRRRDYGRAAGKGPEPVGPIVIASPAWVRVSDKPTAVWAREQAAAALGLSATAELKLKSRSMPARGDERKVEVEFSAIARKPQPAIAEDATLNLFAAQPGGEGTGAPLRVVLMKSFKLPKGGSGTIELQLPSGSRPTRLVGVLQHGKTMQVLDAESIEMK